MSLPTAVKRTNSNKTSSISDTSANLPPPRKNDAPLRRVSLPLTNTRLPRLIYLLALISSLIIAFYSYRVMQWKSEVGGWWNLAVGKRPAQIVTQDGGGWTKRQGKAQKGHHRSETVEDRINALAEALGMPSKDLASAIAGAVKEYVPPATLSSIAAHETGIAVEELINGVSSSQQKDARQAKEQAEAAEDSTSGPGGVMGAMLDGMEGFVGMDEP